MAGGTAVLLNGWQASFSTANQTRYTALGGNTIAIASTTSETAGSYTDRSSPGTLKNLYLIVVANTRSDATSCRVRQNAADTTLIFSIASSTTGTFSDTSDTVTVADGDKLNFAVTTGAGTGGITFAGLGLEFDYSSSGGGWLAFNNDSQNSTNTKYVPLCGNGPTGTTRAQFGTAIYSAGTFRRLAIGAITNNLNSATVCTLGINASNVNETVSVTSSTTGYFEDATNTDAVTAGQTADIQIVTTASSGIITFCGGITLDPTTASEHTTGFGGSNQSTTGAWFTFAGGGANALITTETNGQNPIPCSCTVTDPSVYITTNAAAATSNIVFRKGGVTQNNNISITASTTGRFSDTTPHTDSLIAGDKVGWNVVPGAANTLAFSVLSAKIIGPAAGGGFTAVNRRTFGPRVGSRSAY